MGNTDFGATCFHGTAFAAATRVGTEDFLRIVFLYVDNMTSPSRHHHRSIVDKTASMDVAGNNLHSVVDGVEVARFKP